MMNGLAMNEHIEEISLMFNRKEISLDGTIKLQFYRNQNFDLGSIFCKRGLKIVNIDLGIYGFDKIYLALFEKSLQQPNTVELIRVVNFREKGFGNPRVCCGATGLRLLMSRPLRIPVTLVVGYESIHEFAQNIRSGMLDQFLFLNKP